nr:vespryn-21-like [Pelodiscus sinensis]|eukprot:XP_025038064.1 vespryn-21-like [Pelodiscus sinensis]
MAAPSETAPASAPEPASASAHVHHPESISWECPHKHDLHQFEENVTLDPKTAHPNLYLCVKQKCVTYKDEPQTVPSNPKRFENFFCVLGSKGFTSGNHYWEVVVWSQKDWAVGVAKESVGRKGCINLTPEFGVWAQGRWWVGCDYGGGYGGGYVGGVGPSASEHREDEDEEHESEHRGEHREGEAANLPLGYEGAETIGVFLEYRKGKMTFYEQDKVTIMRANFDGKKVFPFFYVGPGVHLKVIP